mgnify:CR=1 FL=1
MIIGTQENNVGGGNKILCTSTCGMLPEIRTGLVSPAGGVSGFPRFRTLLVFFISVDINIS